MKMKTTFLKTIFKAALLLLAILTIRPVHSHGGGLDYSGCHNNRKTGYRHCHRSGSTPAPKSIGLVSGPVTLLSVGDGATDAERVAEGEQAGVVRADHSVDPAETNLVFTVTNGLLR